MHFLKSINTQLRLPLKVYYDTLVDSKISRSVWLHYVQGFQGWAAGEIIDGKYVEYDGLSGNQLPLFQVVDAFIGLDRFLNEEEMHSYMPLSQRKLTTSLRQHSFRHKAKEDGDSEIEAEMLKIVKQLRVCLPFCLPFFIKRYDTHEIVMLVVSTGSSCAGTLVLKHRCSRAIDYDCWKVGSGKQYCEEYKGCTRFLRCNVGEEVQRDSINVLDLIEAIVASARSIYLARSYMC